MENSGLEMTEMKFLKHLRDNNELFLEEEVIYYRIPKEKLEKFQIEISLNKI